MHGGMDISDRMREQLQKQAEVYLKWESEETELEYQRLWRSLALECLRLASRATWSPLAAQCGNANDPTEDGWKFGKRIGDA